MTPILIRSPWADQHRHGPSHTLGLALQIGFLRVSGRVLDAVRIVPPALWKHPGGQFGEQVLDLASLRAMYRRRRTLFDRQELACETLGFHPLIEVQRRALVRTLRRELRQTADRQRLLAHARQWLYDRKLLVKLRNRAPHFTYPLGPSEQTQDAWT